ncbi:UNVERIFIED_CONTAM: hypothetical protein Slati_3897100 [Sesamum latifolium]|uniref:Uncharacterized protein n=1 Tax=Sesamum latifolium TaxID=2727402 RepID=A0AAW2TND4_9LAMI
MGLLIFESSKATVSSALSCTRVLAGRWSSGECSFRRSGNMYWVVGSAGTAGESIVGGV